MIGRTLGFYFAKLFFKNTLMVFLLILLLIIAVDMTDQARRMLRHPDVPFIDFLMISLSKTPSFAERVIPFAVLFGSISTLIILNKKMELVVARAAGVSVWQFLLPVGIIAVLLGMFSMMVYNPLAIQSAMASKSIEARIYGQIDNTETDRTDNLWIRQYDSAGDMVVHAAVSRNSGRTLNGVTAYRFDAQGYLKERIDANSATFRDAGSTRSATWLFKDVTITTSGRKPASLSVYEVDTNLSASQLDNVSTKPADVSFWRLPARIRQAEEANKIANKYRMQFQTLLARPLFFVAMVIIAASVSLQFVRFGQNSKVILTGILAGFVLYVISELVVGFGNNGIVPPWLAAWSPLTVAVLVGLTIILHQEDG